MHSLVLFGSRATGRAGPESDVDLIVVSPAFEGLGVLARAKLVRRYSELPYPVDVLCYSPAEFEQLRREVGLVGAAIAEGVVV